MSVPLDEIYHYIDAVLDGNAVIYRFLPHGSKNLNDLSILNYDQSENITDLPIMYCHDQEPLDFDQYDLTNQEIQQWASCHTTKNTQKFLPKYNLALPSWLNCYKKRILLHSEINSQQVQRYIDTGLFEPVFWWSHAIIARDWYRYAEHDPRRVWPKNQQSAIVNVYARAWTGTREYRLKLLEHLLPYADKCQVKFNPVDGNLHYQNYVPVNPLLNIKSSFDIYKNYHRESSAMSASYSINDYKNSLFDLVTETVFDDTRIHLTEKILRPIALGQPFILAAGPGSLKFLKEYGFQTFGNIIDESYDDCKDSSQRLAMIGNLVGDLSKRQWNQKDLARLEKICEHNRNWFFSSDFQELILKKLKKDLHQACQVVKEDLSTAWFDWFKQVMEHGTAEDLSYHREKWLKDWKRFQNRLCYFDRLVKTNQKPTNDAKWALHQKKIFNETYVKEIKDLKEL